MTDSEWENISGSFPKCLEQLRVGKAETEYWKHRLNLHVVAGTQPPVPSPSTSQEIAEGSRAKVQTQALQHGGCWCPEPYLLGQIYLPQKQIFKRMGVGKERVLMKLLAF